MSDQWWGEFFARDEAAKKLAATEPTYTDDTGTHCVYCAGEWSLGDDGEVVVSHSAECPWAEARSQLGVDDMAEMRRRAFDMEGEFVDRVFQMAMDLRGFLAGGPGLCDALSETLEDYRTQYGTFVGLGLRAPLKPDEETTG